MVRQETDNYKGVIVCPFCGAKTFVEFGAHGRASSQCRCKKYLVIDFDQMVAIPSKPKRGLSMRFRTKE